MYEIKWHKNLLHKEITLNILSLMQNDCHFEHYILIFFNENCTILIKNSLKFVSKGPISNTPSLVQTMDWHRTGNKPFTWTNVTNYLVIQ